ncbi:hypothetical protein J6590_040499 [Homalodisca vitripennis]|nr:hypothetical protein J6590_040499 [Homalodisca vitripennis]
MALKIVQCYLITTSTPPPLLQGLTAMKVNYKTLQTEVLVRGYVKDQRSNSKVNNLVTLLCEIHTYKEFGMMRSRKRKTVGQKHLDTLRPESYNELSAEVRSATSSVAYTRGGNHPLHKLQQKIKIS